MEGPDSKLTAADLLVILEAVILGFTAPKRHPSFYAERLRNHLSGDNPGKRLARIVERWQGFSFTAAVDGTQREGELAEVGLYVRQLIDALDEDEDELSAKDARQLAASHTADATNGGWLTIKRVAEMLDLSYGQTRQRMLDGRIKTYKDGKHIRTKREWVQEYLQGKLIDRPNHATEVSLGRLRRLKPAKVKLKGIGVRFLRDRKD